MLVVITKIAFLSPVVLASGIVINKPERQEVLDVVKCSCVKGVRSFGAYIPYGTNAVDIKPNTTVAVGTIAIFKYTTTHHIAYVKSIEEKGFLIQETNFKECQYGERFIKWNDPYLEGFALLTNNNTMEENTNVEAVEVEVTEEVVEETPVTDEVSDEVVAEELSEAPTEE